MILVTPVVSTDLSYSDLGNRWLVAAKENADTLTRKRLFKYTHLAADSLKNQANSKELADVILNSFNAIDPNQFELVAEWIFHYTDTLGKENEGAYKSLHTLLLAAGNAKKRHQEEDHNWLQIAQKLISSLLWDSSYKEESELSSFRGITAIDQSNLLKISQKALKHIVKKDRPIPELNDDCKKMIFKHFIKNQHPRDVLSLKTVSSETNRQVASALHVPLKKLKIKTAGQAIAYAKKYGKDLTYVDVSKITFTSMEFKELIGFLNPTFFYARECQLGTESIIALAQSSNFKNLTHLNLGSNYIGNEGLIALADSPHLCNLKSLNLSANGIQSKGAIALTDSPHLVNLINLNLAYNNINNEGLIALATSPNLCNLKSLNIARNRIENKGVVAIARSLHLANLTNLNLGSNHIDNDGLIALAKSLYLTNLKKLNLQYNSFGNDGVIALVRSPNFCYLTELNLFSTVINDEGLSVIVNSPHLGNLKKISLGHGLIKKRDIIAIETAVAQSPYLRNTKLLLGPSFF